jgi:AAA15 family ATPase/GTPase
MLVRFVVNNFLSFENETEFNLIAGNFKNHSNHLYKIKKINLLKTSAIYGANAAGKSNLIKSVFTMQQIIRKGELSSNLNESKFKLNPENYSLPIFFEIELAIDKEFFTYGFSIQGDKIIEEWLYETGSTKPKPIFTRKLNENNKLEIKFAKKFSNTNQFSLLIKLLEENLVEENQLLLCKQELKINVISKIRYWLENKIVIIFPHSIFGSFIPIMSDNQEFNNFTNNIISTFDTGVYQLCIEDIDIDEFKKSLPPQEIDKLFKQQKNNSFVNIKTKNGWFWVSKQNNKVGIKKLVSKHKAIDSQLIPFEITNESDGTQRLLDFIPMFDLLLKEDVTFIIDEIDQSLHSNLLITLITKILSDEIKGQFIFTTHESNLLNLNIFRQDEIWFCEKNSKSGSSDLYSLADYKPRLDLDIRKGYLMGRFGAIPFLANLESLNWSSTDV